MAMVAGSVTVHADESATGTGLAKDLYDEDLASMVLAGLLPEPPTVGQISSPYSPGRPAAQSDVDGYARARLALLKEAARRATAHAAAFVPYFAAHAKARIKNDATGDGLQDGTVHPASDKLIPLE